MQNNNNTSSQTEMNLLDLVFVCDCTGSMGSYIHSAQHNIKSIVEGIIQSEKADVRFALIKYRDHPPQDHTFVTEIKPFTNSSKEMRAYVDTMSASGGGDGPEAVADAMHEALNLQYREGAAKVVVIIADAPPHGLEPNGDGFPNGSPNGHDPILIAKAMSEKDIAIYSVLCEPAINSYHYARDFFIAIAKITGGEYLPLTDAHLLPKIVIGGAVELISLQKLQAEVLKTAEEEHNAAAASGNKLKEEDLVAKLEMRLAEQKVVTNQVKMNDFYSHSYDMENSKEMEHASGLSSVKTKLKPHTGSVYFSSATLAESQSCETKQAAISHSQVTKMSKQCMHKNNWY